MNFIKKVAPSLMAAFILFVPFNPEDYEEDPLRDI